MPAPISFTRSSMGWVNTIRIPGIGSSAAAMAADASDPFSVHTLTSVSQAGGHTPGEAMSVAISGAYAYVADSSQGLRIIPIFVEIARAMERYCPNAILLQHSNPMNPICRAKAQISSTRVHWQYPALSTSAEA